MSDEQALRGFLDKWRTRWPEWNVASVFVPQSQRDVAVAWFALQREMMDAAWGGDDPRPGEAKLAWWAEELYGWEYGRRRHPLGIALQRLPAPWMRLAASVPALLASREPASNQEQASTVLAPFAQSAADVSNALFAADTPAPATHLAGLLAQQLLLRGDAAAPLQTRARISDGGTSHHAVARAWARDLLQRWPTVPSAVIPDRVMGALLQMRLKRFAAGGALVQWLPYPVALWTAWRAARA